MKKTTLFLSIIAIIGFMMINLGNKTTIAKGKLDLIKMASILQDENIMIHEWSLYAREKVESFQSLQEVKKYREELKQKFPESEWTVETNEDNWEATAVISKNTTQVETIKILSTPINGQVQTYVVYEAKGKDWEKQDQPTLTEKIEGRISDIFRGNATIFSCIKGEFNDKMYETLPEEVNHLLSAFDAKEVEALEEDQFISTSAYSPLFAGSVETGSKEDMNLQLGLRTQGLGAKTTIVIGTPIITIEY